MNNIGEVISHYRREKKLSQIDIADMLQAYDIHITKPEGFIRAQDGIKVSLDGAAVEGTLLPVATDGKTHQVEISF